MSLTNLLANAAFLAVSYLITKFIFGYSTYHRYFYWSAPLLVMWAVLQAYVICEFRMDGLFLLYVLLAIIMFVYWVIISKREYETINEVVPTSNHATLGRSAVRTMLYLFLSTGLYLVSLVVGYIWIFNAYYLRF